MRIMNMRENEKVSLKKKTFQVVGDWLAKIAVDTRECRVMPWYEPELTPEMIADMIVE